MEEKKEDKEIQHERQREKEQKHRKIKNYTVYMSYSEMKAKEKGR